MLGTDRAAPLPPRGPDHVTRPGRGERRVPAGLWGARGGPATLGSVPSLRESQQGRVLCCSCQVPPRELGPARPPPIPQSPQHGCHLSVYLCGWVASSPPLCGEAQGPHHRLQAPLPLVYKHPNGLLISGGPQYPKAKRGVHEHALPRGDVGRPWQLVWLSARSRRVCVSQVPVFLLEHTPSVFTEGAAGEGQQTHRSHARRGRGAASCRGPHSQCRQRGQGSLGPPLPPTESVPTPE